MEHRTAGKQNVNGIVIELNCKPRLRVLRCELFHYILASLEVLITVKIVIIPDLIYIIYFLVRNGHVFYLHSDYQ